MPTITLEVPSAQQEIEAGLHATNYADLQTLLNGGLDNSNISASAVLDATARVGVRKNSAGSTFSRRRINFIEGTGVTLTVADDSGGEEVDVTIAASATAPTVYRKVTEKDVNTSVTETDLLNGEITIGAGVMSTNKTVRASLNCDYLNNTGGTSSLQIKIKLGGTTLYDDTIAAASVSASRRAMPIHFEITNAGVTNGQVMIGYIGLGEPGGATTGIGNIGVMGTDPGSTLNRWSVPIQNPGVAVDTTAACALVVTVQHGTSNAAISARLKSALVEVV